MCFATGGNSLGDRLNKFRESSVEIDGPAEAQRGKWGTCRLTGTGHLTVQPRRPLSKLSPMESSGGRPDRLAQMSRQ